MRPTLQVLALAFLVGLPTAGQAQQSAEQRAVLATVDSFFIGMTKGDTVLSRAVLLPGAVFYATLEGPKPVTRLSSDTAYIRNMRTQKQVFLERIWKPTVLVQGAVAEVWTPYDFHVDGKFSHCGIDSFTLVKSEAQWRIATAVYSIQQQGCPESPLGAVK